MTRHRTPTLEVREALLRAARELLDEGGPAALGVRDIAARAGVAPMGVYKRFGSKNGIVDELFRQGFEELAAAVGPAGSDDVRADIAAGMARYREFALANPAVYRLMFDAPVPDFGPSAIAMESARTAFDRLVVAIRLGVAENTFVQGDPVEMAQRFWASCHGALSVQLRGIGFVTDFEAHYTALVETLLRGISVDPTA
ncbi:TetR/AcrR family transcriptional regulator [Pseudonocardia sp. TRM90224]|uniref:TetR/AcrR family transcriptional regulator n=1 Tax=Pseudonocardia sp. TRM90224 TaxID=2812678 RepID=UPI001E3294CD|nr:TetR/AcrR family transcriptional regulator [Pseudonocardia sp. TRM90224]